MYFRKISFNVFKTRSWFFLLSVFIFPFLSGCFGKSDEEKRLECEEQCAKMTSMPSLYFVFMNYDSAEVDSVIVKEIGPGKKDTATYNIKAEYWSENYGTPRKKRWHGSWELKKEIPLKDEYLIIVSGEPPHVLKNLKMGAHPQCDMFNCNFFPGLKTFELDGEMSPENNDGIIIWRK